MTTPRSTGNALAGFVLVVLLCGGCGSSSPAGSYVGILSGGCAIVHDGGGGNHSVSNDGEVLRVSVDGGQHRITLLGCLLDVEPRRSGLYIGPGQSCPSPVPDYIGQVQYNGDLSITSRGTVSGIVTAMETTAAPGPSTPRLSSPAASP